MYNRHTRRHKSKYINTLQVNKRSSPFTPSQVIAASEPWKKPTFSNHSILSFHSQITLIITRYDFFTTTENAMNVP